MEGAVQVIEKGPGIGGAAQQGRMKIGLHRLESECTPRWIFLVHTWCPCFILLGNLPASYRLGIAYRLVYYSALKENYLCFLGVKNKFWLCSQREWESSFV